MEYPNPEQWCNIRQAAEHIGVSVAFLRKAVRLRKVLFARAGSKALRFRRSDLDRWLEANGCIGEPSPHELRRSAGRQ
jgi:excisionase family DNA binding protein